MRGSTETAEGGGGVQLSYLKHSKNVTGCDPQMHTSSNLRISWEMTGGWGRRRFTLWDHILQSKSSIKRAKEKDSSKKKLINPQTSVEKKPVAHLPSQSFPALSDVFCFCLLLFFARCTKHEARTYKSCHVSGPPWWKEQVCVRKLLWHNCCNMTNLFFLRRPSHQRHARCWPACCISAVLFCQKHEAAATVISPYVCK